MGAGYAFVLHIMGAATDALSAQLHVLPRKMAHGTGKSRISQYVEDYHAP
jgi:hypothetical protein